LSQPTLKLGTYTVRVTKLPLESHLLGASTATESRSKTNTYLKLEQPGNERLGSDLNTREIFSLSQRAQMGCRAQSHCYGVVTRDSGTEKQSWSLNSISNPRGTSQNLTSSSTKHPCLGTW